MRSSPVWDTFHCFHLCIAHRQQSDPSYARWIEHIGNGSISPNYLLNDERGYIALDLCTVITSEDGAIRFAFPNINDPHACSLRRILATTNDVVDKFNDCILDELTRTFLLRNHVARSADFMDMSTVRNPLGDHISPYFLNLQNHPGVPPHALRLVVGALYEVTRNFAPDDGLMYHTQVILVNIFDKHVLIRTLTGAEFPLPRICFRWSMSGGSVYVVRRQYPLRPAYASTFNGSQGSTLEDVLLICVETLSLMATCM